MSDLINGAGGLVALSAVPMMIGLILREGRLAEQLRRLALVMALALPVLFMGALAVLYTQQPGSVPPDFQINDSAARLLYGIGGNPYEVHAAYSFPFPTFYLYWLNSGFGTLSQPAAWIMWWIVNAGLWFFCAVLLWRTIPRPASRRGRDVLRYATVGIPAVVTIWQGQTALLVLLGLLPLIMVQDEPHPLNPPRYGVERGRPDKSIWRRWLVGGVGLAWATLIKPQMALVGAGLLLYALIKWRQGDRETAWTVMGVLGAAAVSGIVAIGLTLLLPGGITFETYQRFVTEALPQVARAEDNITVIGSPAFVAEWLALRAGLATNVAGLISTAVTLIVVGAGAIWTVRRADRSLYEIAAGWAVWAMVAPRVAWTWYGAWCLPFFLLATSEAVQQRQSWRLFGIVLVLGLLSLQSSLLLIATLNIALLIGLLWTAFLNIDPTKSVD